MTHRNGQSMRRQTKSTHIADYSLPAAGACPVVEARRLSIRRRARVSVGAVRRCGLPALCAAFGL
jgi:hypothetical protein